MDQDSFRRLLQTPKPQTGKDSPQATQSPRFTSKQNSTLDASQPVFKPRRVNKPKLGETYRDRAAERREGGPHDYTEVEALLEDFERRVADTEDKAAVEEQRRYLGGDKDHTILVKGLDFALLEQNRARAAAVSSTEDDDSLEKAFIEASKPIDVEGGRELPHKKTREELLKVLEEKKRKRAPAAGPPNGADGTQLSGQVNRSLEEAKKAGKFRPIGAPEEQAPKKKHKNSKAEGGEGKRRKKKKEQDGPAGDDETNRSQAQKSSEAGPGESAKQSPPTPLAPYAAPEVESLEEESDIFAGAGSYEGIDLGEDDDDEAGEEKAEPHKAEEPQPPSQQVQLKRRWIELDDEPPLPPDPLPGETLASKEESHAEKGERHLSQPIPDEDGEVEGGHPMRLQPLASSALPSIRDFLDMEQAANGRGKKGKRKRGKGGKDKGGGSDDEDKEGGSKKASKEEKADRDYKRLKSYTDKKAAAIGK